MKDKGEFNEVENTKETIPSFKGTRIGKRIFRRGKTRGIRTANLTNLS